MMKDYYDGKTYMQTDTYGSWRDMNNRGLLQGILETKPSTTQTQLPRFLRGDLKALYYPKEQTDWPLAPDKAYKRVIFLDSQGLVSYTYMEAKWIPAKGDDLTREQFVYLLCTHLTLHFVCIGPNY